MINSVCHFEIPADDVEGLQKFYKEMFGWTFEAMPGPIPYHIINTGEGQLAGGMMQRQDPSQCPVNYIMVESIEVAFKKAIDLGAKAIMPVTPVPCHGRFAVLMDPQNNPIGLWQDDPQAT